MSHSVARDLRTNTTTTATTRTFVPDVNIRLRCKVFWFSNHFQMVNTAGMSKEAPFS